MKRKFSPAKLCDFSGDLSKSWYIYYSVEDPDTGRMVRFKYRGDLNRNRTLRERRAAANVIISEINGNLKAGWSPLADTLRPKTLQALCAEFLTLKQASLKRRSWQSYKYAWDAFIRYLSANHPLIRFPEEVTPQIARGFVDGLIKEGRTGKGVNSLKEFNKTLFRMMQEREIISRNPFDKIPKQPETSRRNRAFTRHELDRIWSTLQPAQRTFTRLIYFTYLREIEILRLKVGDVNLPSGIITISGDQAKNRKSESVVIPERFREELRDYIGKAPASCYLFGFKWRPSPRPMARNTVSKVLNAHIDRLGFGQDYTAYGFKHSGVVAAYQAGIDLYSISRQLRHSSLSITQIYLRSLGLQPNTEFAEKMR